MNFDFVGKIVAAVDAINSNVWAFLALCIGAFLSVHKLAIGDQIVMAAFALLRGGPSDAKVPPPSA